MLDPASSRSRSHLKPWRPLPRSCILRLAFNDTAYARLDGSRNWRRTHHSGWHFCATSGHASCVYRHKVSTLEHFRFPLHFFGNCMLRGRMHKNLRRRTPDLASDRRSRFRRRSALIDQAITVRQFDYRPWKRGHRTSRVAVSCACCCGFGAHWICAMDMAPEIA
jgi:hypothetical protein